MIGDFRFIDRAIAWFVHFSSGIPVRSKEVPEEQSATEEVHRGSLPHKTPSSDLPSGGDAGIASDRESREPKVERYIHLDCVEGN